MLHPIAGTRWRGATPEEDAALAAELLADPKERAEHVMLVDLGRNDLGRVCQPGTVEVAEFITVERYSHVMHIVSTVVGSSRQDRSAFDVLAAMLPGRHPLRRAQGAGDGDHRGARADPARRSTAACVGYFGFGGDMDTAIAIRTALLRDGTAYVQAGGRHRRRLRPGRRGAECRNKAAAVLRAVAAAETLRAAR